MDVSSIKLTEEEIQEIKDRVKSIPQTKNHVEQIYIGHDLDTVIMDLQEKQEKLKEYETYVQIGTMYIAGFEEACLEICYETEDNQERYLQGMLKSALELKRKRYRDYLESKNYFGEDK